MDRQLAIYEAGTRQVRPRLPIALEELKEQAREATTREAWGFLAGGAGAGDTMRANRRAFGRWHLMPRMLRDVSQRDLSVEVCGQRLPCPILLAPIGAQGIYHAEGELATARGAVEAGLGLVLSTVSSQPLEAVAEAMGDLPHWFQLYWCRDRDLTASLVERAEKAGFGAIVLTLDVPLLAWREPDLENAYLPFLYGDGVGSFFTDPVFRSRLERSPEEDPAAAIRLFTRVFGDPSLSWDDLDWLRRTTDLPILLKGILAADDARRAVDHGVDGIVVSNHGGRQVDGAIAALDALPEIVRTVDDRLAVLFDSGIRRGSDVLKAIALGARAVLVGRPYILGLAVDGSAGVEAVLSNLVADVDLTLGLVGCRSFADLDGEFLKSPRS
ncbi:MAG: alpha-hydroxy-acid oxidizing protein [Thermoanaerobaculia bacterium]|nr:alpha-hydroxy-acid oxidizing protein [Thermoanaerobaculia bacterium]